MQYGIFAANYPLTEDDLESRKLPRGLEQYSRKLFGLTIKPDRLQQIRNERRPDSRYSSPRQVAFEVRAAESLFERHGIPVHRRDGSLDRGDFEQNTRSHRYRATLAAVIGRAIGCDAPNRLQFAWVAMPAWYSLSHDRGSMVSNIMAGPARRLRRV